VVGDVILLLNTSDLRIIIIITTSSRSSTNHKVSPVKSCSCQSQMVETCLLLVST